MFKGHDQCGENYKILFTKVFHIFLYLTILKLQYVLLWTNTLQTLYHIFFTQRRIPMNYIKTTFSLLISTLYSMSNMQWNMDFCYLNNYNDKKSSQCSCTFYRPFKVKKLCGYLVLCSNERIIKWLFVFFVSLKLGGHLIALF
jgi:hypothetical protein